MEYWKLQLILDALKILKKQNNFSLEYTGEETDLIKIKRTDENFSFGVLLLENDFRPEIQPIDADILFPTSINDGDRIKYRLAHIIKYCYQNR